MKHYFKQITLVLLAAGGGIGVGPNSAHALPLLSDSEGIRFSSEDSGEDAVLATFHPDSEDPNKFYFMADTSKFVQAPGSSLPSFGLVHWGLSDASRSDAGGYLSFVMKLDLGAGLRKAMKLFMQSHPNARLAVLPFKESTITSSTAASLMFKEFSESRGGRAEDDIGVDAWLTRTGANIVLSGIDNPLAASFRYCYKVQGLGAQEESLISVDMKWLYDHFKANASAGGWWTKVSLGKTIEKLTRENNIIYKTKGGEMPTFEQLQNLSDQIIKRIFVVHLDGKPDTAKTSSGFSVSRISLNHTVRDELSKETWQISGRPKLEKENCLPLPLSSLKSLKNRVVQEVTNP